MAKRKVQLDIVEVKNTQKRLCASRKTYSIVTEAAPLLNACVTMSNLVERGRERERAFKERLQDFSFKTILQLDNHLENEETEKVDDFRRQVDLVVSQIPKIEMMTANLVDKITSEAFSESRQDSFWHKEACAMLRNLNEIFTCLDTEKMQRFEHLCQTMKLIEEDATLEEMAALLKHVKCVLDRLAAQARAALKRRFQIGEWDISPSLEILLAYLVSSAKGLCHDTKLLKSAQGMQKACLRELREIPLKFQAQRRQCLSCMESRLVLRCSRDHENSQICTECYSNRVFSNESPEEQERILRFCCILPNCDGVYDRRMFSSLNTEAYQKLVDMEAEKKAQVQIEGAFQRERKFWGDAIGIEDFAERFLKYEEKTVEQICTNKCPECLLPFGDEYEACCALTCINCKAHFCALCFRQADSREQNHRHIERCPKRRRFVMTGQHFCSKEEWRKGNALLINEVLETHLGTIPSNLTIGHDGETVQSVLRRRFAK